MLAEVVVSRCVYSGPQGPISWTEVLREERRLHEEAKSSLFATAVANEYHDEVRASHTTYKVEVALPVRGHLIPDTAVLYVKEESGGGIRHHTEFPG